MLGFASSAQPTEFRGFRSDTKYSSERGQLIMSTAITIDETLVHSRTPQQLQQDVKAGLLLLDYLRAEISLGRFAELMDMNYVQARDWLHQQGIPTMRQFTDHELEQKSNTNYRQLADKLGILLPENR